MSKTPSKAAIERRQKLLDEDREEHPSVNLLQAALRAFALYIDRVDCVAREASRELYEAWGESDGSRYEQGRDLIKSLMLPEPEQRSLLHKFITQEQIDALTAAGYEIRKAER